MIGMGTTAAVHRRTRQERQAAVPACCVGARGATPTAFSALAAATTTLRAIGTATMGFGWCAGRGMVFQAWVFSSGVGLSP